MYQANEVLIDIIIERVANIEVPIKEKRITHQKENNKHTEQQESALTLDSLLADIHLDYGKLCLLTQLIKHNKKYGNMLLEKETK